MDKLNPDQFHLIDEVLISDTQSVRIGTVEAGGETKIYIMKFWRRHVNSDWLPGKGFVITKEIAQAIIDGVKKALKTL